MKYLVGIDEAGRGPLAGPVAVGVLMISKENFKKIQKELRIIKGKDSKKLSHEQREVWFEKIKKWKQEKILDFHVSLISSKIIDTKGISFAIKSGIKNSLKKVKAYSSDSIRDLSEFRILLDGSLKAPEEFANQKTIIKGDEKEPVISLASICAKVTRDDFMCKLSLKYAHYGFEIHKGYGTLKHRKAIRTYGICEVHRQSFLTKIR